MAGWGRCRNCRSPIWWGTSPYGTGKAFPFDDEDETASHFETCAAQKWVEDEDGERHAVSTCKACGKQVWWQTLSSGKRRPMDVDGDVATWECHFDTCSAKVAADVAEYDRVWAQANEREASATAGTPAEVGLWLGDLGLSWPTTLAEVTTTFRRLAMTHHPDMGGDASAFIRIKLAFDRLRELMPQEVHA